MGGIKNRDEKRKLNKVFRCELSWRRPALGWRTTSGSHARVLPSPLTASARRSQLGRRRRHQGPGGRGQARPGGEVPPLRQDLQAGGRWWGPPVGRSACQPAAAPASSQLPAPIARAAAPTRACPRRRTACSSTSPSSTPTWSSRMPAAAPLQLRRRRQQRPPQPLRRLPLQGRQARPAARLAAQQQGQPRVR
jgi:hypothetical protein